MKRRSFAVAQTILIALVILAGSIALPILCRPFYYWHIGPMELAEQTGLSVQEIKTAYNEMMDYSVGLTDTFSTGVLPWSEDGRAHFADVRKLFILDLWVLAVAAVVLIILRLIQGKEKVHLLKHTPGFWSAIGLVSVFSVTAGLAALDFNRAFVVFHQLFFPGKDNWMFDYYTDPIIRILPEAFFRNCAILILACIFTGCVICLLSDGIARKKQKKEA